MKQSQPVYRVRQFWAALHERPDPAGLDEARRLLSPELLALFLQMQPGEQAHSLKIFQQLKNQGESSPDLLAAALLHDVGKIRYPLRLWERVWVVLAQAWLPRLAAEWGQGQPTGLRRALAAAVQHPAWGAELVAAAGGAPLLVELIRRHQQPAPPHAAGRTDLYLRKLQILDDQN